MIQQGESTNSSLSASWLKLNNYRL